MTNYILYLFGALGLFIFDAALNLIIRILFFINKKYFYIGFLEWTPNSGLFGKGFIFMQFKFKKEKRSKWNRDIKGYLKLKLDQKIKIVELYLQDFSILEISKIMKNSYSACYSVIEKYKKFGYNSFAMEKKKGRKSKINLDAQKAANFKINIENKIEDKDLLIKQLKEENKILKLENAIAKKVSALVQLKDSLTKKNSK